MCSNIWCKFWLPTDSNEMCCLFHRWQRSRRECQQTRIPATSIEYANATRSKQSKYQTHRAVEKFPRSQIFRSLGHKTRAHTMFMSSPFSIIKYAIINLVSSIFIQLHEIDSEFPWNLWLLTQKSFLINVWDQSIPRLFKLNWFPALPRF